MLSTVEAHKSTSEDASQPHIISSAHLGTESEMQGQGLIELAGGDATPSVDSEAAVDSGSEAVVWSDSSSTASTSYDPDHALRPGAKDRPAVSQIKLICIDMDGARHCDLLPMLLLPSAAVCTSCRACQWS